MTLLLTQSLFPTNTKRLLRGDKRHEYCLDSTFSPAGREFTNRALRAFLSWWKDEIEPKDWWNPIRKVKAPKVPEKILEPADTGDIQRLLTTCDKDYTGQRDRAIILTLLDTGVRAAELSMAFGTAPSG